MTNSVQEAKLATCLFNLIHARLKKTPNDNVLLLADNPIPFNLRSTENLLASSEPQAFIKAYFPTLLKQIIDTKNLNTQDDFSFADVDEADDTFLAFLPNEIQDRVNQAVTDKTADLQRAYILQIRDSLPASISMLLKPLFDEKFLTLHNDTSFTPPELERIYNFCLTELTNQIAPKSLLESLKQRLIEDASEKQLFDPLPYFHATKADEKIIDSKQTFKAHINERLPAYLLALEDTFEEDLTAIVTVAFDDILVKYPYLTNTEKLHKELPFLAFLADLKKYLYANKSIFTDSKPDRYSPYQVWLMTHGILAPHFVKDVKIGEVSIPEENLTPPANDDGNEFEYITTWSSLPEQMRQRVRFAAESKKDDYLYSVFQNPEGKNVAVFYGVRDKHTKFNIHLVPTKPGQSKAIDSNTLYVYSENEQLMYLVNSPAGSLITAKIEDSDLLSDYAQQIKQAMMASETVLDNNDLESAILDLASSREHISRSISLCTLTEAKILYDLYVSQHPEMRCDELLFPTAENDNYTLLGMLELAQQREHWVLTYIDKTHQANFVDSKGLGSWVVYSLGNIAKFVARFNKSFRNEQSMFDGNQCGYFTTWYIYHLVKNRNLSTMGPIEYKNKCNDFCELLYLKAKFAYEQYQALLTEYPGISFKDVLMHAANLNITNLGNFEHVLELLAKKCEAVNFDQDCELLDNDCIDVEDGARYLAELVYAYDGELDEELKLEPTGGKPVPKTPPLLLQASEQQAGSAASLGSVDDFPRSNEAAATSHLVNPFDQQPASTIDNVTSSVVAVTSFMYKAFTGLTSNGSPARSPSATPPADAALGQVTPTTPAAAIVASTTTGTPRPGSRRGSLT